MPNGWSVGKVHGDGTITKMQINNSRNNMTLVARKARVKQRGRFSSYNVVR